MPDSDGGMYQSVTTRRSVPLCGIVVAGHEVGSENRGNKGCHYFHVYIQGNILTYVVRDNRNH